MATFNVHVTIENKPGISDPEGETILNDLVSENNKQRYWWSGLPDELQKDIEFEE